MAFKLFSRNNSAYDTKSRLSEEEYGRHRDRINQQQMARREKEKDFDRPLVFGVLAFLGALLAVWLLFYIFVMLVRAIIPTFVLPRIWYIYGFLAAAIAGLIVYDFQARKDRARRQLTDDGILNDYANDSHLKTNEEIIEEYPMIPDAGAHYTGHAATIISHLNFDDKTAPKIKRPVRYEGKPYESKDVKIAYLDEDGRKQTSIERVYSGEIKVDEFGDTVYETVPIIDRKFGHDLFDASGIEASNKVGYKFFDPKRTLNGSKRADRPFVRKIKVDDGEEKEIKTYRDLMMYDWEIPDYEMQRPGGGYLVDTNPVNTLVVAITRGGNL